MSAFRPKALFLPLLLLAACSDDPFDPCAEAGCGVEGVDLALVQAEIDWQADQPVDDRVGGRLVQPGDEMIFRYSVLNRGTETSEPTILEVGTPRRGSNNFGIPVGLVTIEIPALDPGEHVSGTRVVEAPMTVTGMHTDELLGGFWLGGYFFQPFTDVDWSNHTREIRYHLAVGYAAMDLTVPYADTLRVGQSDSVWVTIVNPSHVASLDGDLHIAFCTLVHHESSVELGCAGDAFGAQPVGDLAARTTEYVGVELSIPPQAMLIQATDVIALRTCIFDGPPAENGLDLVTQMSASCADALVPIVQDIGAACAPPEVALPATLDASDTASDCEWGDYYTYDVWAFDAEAAAIRSIEPVAGDLAQVMVFGPDHVRIELNSTGQFFTSEPGRYHVVVEESTAAPIFTIE